MHGVHAAPAEEPDDAAHGLRKARAVDFRHREHRDPCVAHEVALARIEVARPGEADIARVDLATGRVQVDEFRKPEPAGRRKALPVDVARRGSLRRVEVAVRVDVQDAELPSFLSRPSPHAGQGAERHGVVAAEDERERARRGGLLDARGERRARGGDLREVLGPGVPRIEAFLRLGRDRAFVAPDLMPERREALAKARKADRRRTHVGPVAARPEIERHLVDVQEHGRMV